MLAFYLILFALLFPLGFREHHKFILTQAPLNYTIGHFWEMVWQEKCALIVSMVPIDGTKCPAYIPTNAGQKVSFHAFSIQHMGTRTVRKAYDATMLTVSSASFRVLMEFCFRCKRMMNQLVKYCI